MDNDSDAVPQGPCTGPTYKGCIHNYQGIYTTLSNKTWKGPSFRALLCLCESCKDEYLKLLNGEQEAA
jgi:hypothetical protein